MGRRWAPAVCLAVLLVASGPFMGRLRDLLLDAFPRGALRLLAVGFAAAVVAALVWAAVRIRERRRSRYAALGLVVAVVAAQALLFGTGDLRVDAVERLHLLEYGLLAALAYRALLPRGDGSPLPLALAGAAFVGLADEWLQWLVPSRIGDARDVVLDLVAAACGVLFAWSLWPTPTARLRPDSRRWLRRLAAADLVALGVFLHLAHLGYEVRDPEIGAFRSYFTAERLRELRAARRRDWRRAPPAALPLLGKEDFYLTEAGWHAQAREAARQRGDAWTAWKENRILERYYRPYLDLPAFAGGGPRRLPASERADLRRRRPPRDPATYESAALAERVWLRPRKTTLWLLVLGGAAALLWAPPPGGWRRRPG